MKKQSQKFLKFRKNTISNLQGLSLLGGANTQFDDITTLRFICTNHPAQNTDFECFKLTETCHTGPASSFPPGYDPDEGL